MNSKEKKSILELLEFLDADMPSKIFPEDDKFKDGEIWIREDHFTNEEDVSNYLIEHFKIAFPNIFAKCEDGEE